MKKEVIICFALVFILLTSISFAFAFIGSGSGTSADPYQITSCNHLQDMKNALNSYYILVNDINCSTTKTWNSGKGFEPIGKDTTPFTGVLIGNEKGIKNLYINRSNEDYIGLFGSIGGSANISNTGLADSIILGNNYTGYIGLVSTTNAIVDSITIFNSEIKGNSIVGGLTGRNYGKINNSMVLVSNATGKDTYIGGFVGLNSQQGIIEHSSSNVNVKGKTYVGGFAGTNYYGTISYSSFFGDVTGTYNQAGGFVGRNTGAIKDSSFINGNVKGVSNVGGFVGSNENGGIYNSSFGIKNSELLSLITGKLNTNVTGNTNVGGFVGNNLKIIQNSYSLGNVNGANQVGGFAGRNYVEGAIENSYSNVNVTGNSSVGGFVGYNGGKEIKKSYSSGKITGVADVGGFAGKNTGSIIYENNFWNIDAVGYSLQDSGIGDLNGITAKDTPNMKQNITFANAGWDFAGTWAINEGTSYPCLYLESDGSSCPASYVSQIPQCTWNQQNSSCINDTFTKYYVKISTDECTGTPPSNSTHYCDSENNRLIGEHCPLNLDSVLINGEDINSSEIYNATRDIDLYNGNANVLFSWNFSASTLNICQIEVETSGSTASKGHIIVRNSGASGKTLFFDKKSGNSTSVCIKDEEGINSIDDISNNCNSTNEFLVPCPGSSSGYNCNITNNQFKIWPLNHSAAIEFLNLNITNTTGTNVTCTNNWTCTNWSSCVIDTETRVCTDLNSCNNTINKPIETQTCGGGNICDPIWNCGGWGDCIDGSQTRICTDDNICGDDTNKPDETQTCTSKEINWKLIGIIGGGVILLIIILIVLIKVFSKKEEYAEEVQEVQTPSAPSPPKTKQDDLYYPK